MTHSIDIRPNPQGKGISGIVEDLQSYKPLLVEAKASQQWLADYFTSMLVLNAKYGFKPVVGNDYYLYLKNQEWRLSLIEPKAWTPKSSGIYFAKCTLHIDMSWSLVPKLEWMKDQFLVTSIKQLHIAFLASIDNEKPIVNQLPYFIHQLSYYQRLGANALAYSLRLSLDIQLGEDMSRQLSGRTIIDEARNSIQPLLAYTCNRF